MSVLDFSVTVINNINKQTLSLLIEHFEEEQLKVKHQSYITHHQLGTHEPLLE